ncbi:restriction endonuclease subunit S [Comamonas nitrativorans]|uniref:Restriction endonuclease subunit S n=1 Tax=Comamonas nitrativorans TaxID=108437 RepID=A0ABV9GTM7_9BURK
MSGLPCGWARATLGEIATFEMGQAPAGSASNFDGIGTIFVKAGEFGALYPVIREWTTEPKKFARDGDVLICVVGATSGKLNLGIDCAIGRSVAAIRPISGISQKSIYYQLLPRVELLRANSTGSAQGVISQADLAKLDVLLPPRIEQTRIVEKLESLLADLDAGVAELKAAQRKLARYRQSLLKAAVEGALTAEWREANVPQETGAQLLQRILRERRARFEQKHGPKKKYKEPATPDTSQLPALPEGWVWASLDQIVTESSYGTSEKCGYEAGGTPVLRIPNVGSGTLDLRDMKFSQAALQLDDDNALAVGDVLVIRTNGSIGLVGRAAVVTKPLPAPHYFASYLLRLRCVEVTCTHIWIQTLLCSPAGRSWLEQRAASSAGQHNVSLSTLLTMAIPLPPLAEQHQILTQLDTALSACKAQENAVTHALKQAAAQRRNLLRAAFAGELVPQDPADEPASVLLARICAKRVQEGKAVRKSIKRSGAST